MLKRRCFKTSGMPRSPGCLYPVALLFLGLLKGSRLHCVNYAKLGHIRHVFKNFTDHRQSFTKRIETTSILSRTQLLNLVVSERESAFYLCHLTGHWSWVLLIAIWGECCFRAIRAGDKGFSLRVTIIWRHNSPSWRQYLLSSVTNDRCHSSKCLWTILALILTIGWCMFLLSSRLYIPLWFW